MRFTVIQTKEKMYQIWESAFTYVTDDIGNSVTRVHFPSFAKHAQSNVNMCQRFLIRVVMRRFGQLLQVND